jgi:hypothetical protein
MTAVLEIEPAGEASGVCDCCDTRSSRVWGFVRKDGGRHVAYFVQWTEGHLREYGATWDIVLGRWGDGAAAEGRCVARLACRFDDDRSGLMVIDARLDGFEDLANRARARSDIIGSPLAEDIFAICDAVILQDERVPVGSDAI